VGLSDLDLLATCVWDEARGESQAGRVAVARVVMNRMHAHYQSDGTVDGTVLRKDQFSGFYFAFIGGHYTRIGSTEAQALGEAMLLYAQAKAEPIWPQCVAAARAALVGDYSAWPEVQALGDGALNYANLAISKPVWATSALFIASIGNHSFYRAASVVLGVHQGGKSVTDTSAVVIPAAANNGGIDQAALNAAVAAAIAQAQPVKPATVPSAPISPAHVGMGVGGLLTGIAGALGTVAVNNHGGLPETHLDLAPILTPAIQVLTLVALAIAAWAVKRGADWFHISTTSSARTLVLDAVDNAISFAASQAQGRIATYQPAADPRVAGAVNYLVQKVPGTLKLLGINVNTPAGQQAIADLVTARLPKS
jgi:hypothetical protein